MGTPRHVLHVFSTFAPAGPELRAVALMAGLGDGFRHTIVAMDDCHDAERHIPGGVAFELRPGPGDVGSRAAIGWTRRTLRELRPDLVLTYNWGAFDAVIGARLSRFRAHVHHEDGFNLDEAVKQVPRRLWARRLFLRCTPTVIVPSRNLERIAQDTWWLPETRLQFIANGVDLEAYAPRDAEAARVRLGLPSKTRVIGTVAGHRPVKRLDRLIEAFAKIDAVHDAHLVLVGDGPERESLVRLAKERHVTTRVHMLGMRDDLPKIYPAFDVFCLSSDSEQQPVSMLEAMGSGCAIVATDVGDVRATLPDGAAPYLVDPNHADASGELARAFSALLADPDARQAQVIANRARVEERYAFSSMLDRYRVLYDRALG